MTNIYVSLFRRFPNDRISNKFPEILESILPFELLFILPFELSIFLITLILRRISISLHTDDLNDIPPEVNSSRWHPTKDLRA